MHAAVFRKSRAFSLIELVIVVVIIGIIAAIAIPRMSRGASGANDGALQSNLAALRKAIDLYAAEHNNKFPSVADFEALMTGYSNEAGTKSPDGTSANGYIFGPYIRAIPVQTVGPRKGSKGVAAADGAGVGWLYNETTGVITANVTTETDASGKLYLNY
jgi:prepilin-type N-terminal cleavage/methylation domain-containing protein